MRKPIISWQKICLSLLIVSAFCIPVSTALTNVFFPIAILLTFFTTDGLKTRVYALWQQPAARYFCLLFGLFVVGLLYTLAPLPVALQRLAKVTPLLLGALLMVSLSADSARRYVLNGFLAALALTLLLSFVHFYWWPDMHFSRLGSLGRDTVFKDHISQGFLLSIFLLIVAYRALNRRGYWRYGYALLALLSAYNLLLVNTGRVAYVVLLAVGLILMLMTYRWRGLMLGLLVACGLFAVAMLTSQPFQQRIHALGQDYHHYEQGQKYSSLGIRIISYMNSWRLIKARPLAGYGTGSYQTAYATLATKYTKVNGAMPLSYNSFLNLWVELGLLGVSLGLYLFWRLWRDSFALSGEWRFIAQVTLISMFVGCLINPWFSDTTELHSFCLLIPLCYAGFSLKKEKAAI